MRLGFELAEASCVWANEIDKFCAITYRENFGDSELVVGDIRDIPSSAIPDFDILCAGFPCQPFSLAGVSKRNSLGRVHGFEDRTYGTLFHEIVRIARDKRPLVLFLENVSHLERHDGGRTFLVIREAIEGLGYSFHYKVLDACGFVPQRRKRIFIICFRDGIKYEFPELPDGDVRLRDILEDEVDEKYTLSDRMWECLKRHAERHRHRGHGFGYGLADPDGITRTLLARYYKDGSEILIPQKGKNPRRLTPRECARLMGFPDWFKIPVSDTRAYKQFGNSVVVPLVEFLARSVINALQGQKRLHRP